MVMKHQSDEPRNENGGSPRHLEPGRLLWGLLYDLRLTAVSSHVSVPLGDMCEDPQTVNCFHDSHAKFVERFLILVLETGAHCVAQSEFLIFLLQFS